MRRRFPLRVTAVGGLAVLLGVAVVAAWLLVNLTRAGPDREVELEVVEGAPVRAILDDLHHRELLPSPLAGRVYLVLFARDRPLHYGRYRFPPRQRPAAVLEQLLEGRLETVTVTVPEGLTAAETGARFAAAGVGAAADWLELEERAEWVHDLAPEAASLEGFLFPDTYTLPAGASASHAGRLMVQRFRSVWRDVTAAAPTPWGPTHQVVTLASLVEAETAVADERPRVAGVLLNRLRLGMPLQCDPTVAYALKRRGEWTGRLLRVHWQVDDPYNTYRYPGLPPGPVNSPGRAAIAAALDPEEHRYLYFVARGDGGHTFSRTLEEHNLAVARLLRARR